jgi:hypothetical protein
MNAPLPTRDEPRSHAEQHEPQLPLPLAVIWRTLYWTYERATWQYDLMVVAILAFVWLTPPAWLGDPTARGLGPIAWLGNLLGWFGI